MTKALSELQQDFAAKREEIERLVAEQLGYGDLSTLSEADRLKVRDDAEDAITAWEEGPEMEVTPLRPSGALQRLLSEHHEIGEQILDCLDDQHGIGSED